MTLAEQVTQLADTAYVGRIRQALVKAAVAVMAEAANTTGHELRVAYARAVLGAPDDAGILAARAVVTNAGLDGTDTDNDIEFTVNSMFNALAGVAN